MDEEDPIQNQDNVPCAQELHESSSEDEQLLQKVTKESTGIEKPGSADTGKAMNAKWPARFANSFFVKGAAALLCLTALVAGIVLLRHSRPEAIPIATKGSSEAQEEDQADSSPAGFWQKNTMQGDQPTSIGHWQEPWGLALTPNTTSTMNFSELTGFAFDSAVLHISSVRTSELMELSPMYRLETMQTYYGRSSGAKSCNASFPNYRIQACSGRSTTGCLDEEKWLSYSRLDAFVGNQIVPMQIDDSTTVLPDGAKIMYTLWLDDTQRPLVVREVEREREFFVEARKSQTYGIEYFYDLLENAYDYIKTKCYKVEGSNYRGYQQGCNGYQASITSVPKAVVQYALQHFDSCGYFSKHIVERNTSFFKADMQYDGWVSAQHTAVDVWYQQAKDALDIVFEPIKHLSMKEVELKYGKMLKNASRHYMNSEYTVVMTGYIDYYKH